MNKFRLFSTITLLLTISTLFAAAPKREFRGAWIQAVNGQFQGIPTAELKQTLISQLDSLEKARINAVLTPEMRRTILELKYLTPDDEHIMGIEYYQAVIADGIRSYPEFIQWRKKHAAKGIVNWCP